MEELAADEVPPLLEPAEEVAEALEVSLDVVLAVVDPPDDPLFDEPLLDDPPPELPLSSANVHCFVSCTSSFPLGLMGVSVIWHVSVTGPIAL